MVVHRPSCSTPNLLEKDKQTISGLLGQMLKSFETVLTGMMEMVVVSRIISRVYSTAENPRQSMIKKVWK
ncbi:Uncharacterized protein APZ42_000004 [Daphnia magna]|uniref:Uncharacterized protein n=1 Tax=Daphnia magna TaxID=35525 RepID=A0A0P5UT12_9CRUS|nr:Uncharacterized protein APZ42_000004 [Daphnia magna]